MSTAGISPSLQRRLNNIGLPVDAPHLADVFDTLSDAVETVIGLLDGGRGEDLLFREGAMIQFISTAEACVERLCSDDDRRVLDFTGYRKHVENNDWKTVIECVETLLAEVVSLRKNEGDLSVVEAAARNYRIWIACRSYFIDAKRDLRLYLRSRSNDFDTAEVSCYPIKSADGRSMAIDLASISDSCVEGLVAREPILPFFSDDAHRREQAHAGVVCRAFQSSDVRNPAERTMLGGSPPHMTVVTRRPYRRFEPIAIYGGRYIRKQDRERGRLSDKTFRVNYANSANALYKAFTGESAFEFVIGDGLASRINTIYEEKPDGGFRQARDGYNVCLTMFKARTTGGEDIVLLLYFADADLPPETELRVSYGHPDDSVDQKLHENSQVPLTLEQMASKHCRAGQRR